jgi:hypothetical protein
MKESDIPVIQASLDQLQRQLNAIYTQLLFDSVPDSEERTKLKAATSAEWTAAYQKAKDTARG